MTAARSAESALPVARHASTLSAAVFAAAMMSATVDGTVEA
jgi:hypothetical protein